MQSSALPAVESSYVVEESLNQANRTLQPGFQSPPSYRWHPGWYYQDSWGTFQGPFDVQQLRTWRPQLPGDLEVWHYFSSTDSFYCVKLADVVGQLQVRLVSNSPLLSQVKPIRYRSKTCSTVLAICNWWAGARFPGKLGQ